MTRIRVLHREVELTCCWLSSREAAYRNHQQEKSNVQRKPFRRAIACTFFPSENQPCNNAARAIARTELQGVAQPVIASRFSERSNLLVTWSASLQRTLLAMTTTNSEDSPCVESSDTSARATRRRSSSTA